MTWRGGAVDRTQGNLENLILQNSVGGFDCTDEDTGKMEEHQSVLLLNRHLHYRNSRNS